MRWVILRVVSGFIFPFLFLFSLFLLFRGHQSPGGGFIAGVSGGISLTLLLISFGITPPFSPLYLIALGLLISAGTGIASLFFGFEFLKSEVFHFSFPFFGSVHIPSSLFFDIGIFFSVLGCILLIVQILGGEG